VCRDARLGDRAGALPAAIVLVLLSALAFTWLRRGRARALGVLVVASVAALPGAHAVLALRADRPAAIEGTARASIRLHDEIRAFALRHGCAEVVVDRCPVCMPPARLALAGLRCDAPAAIELGPGALSGACHEHEDRLVCGGAP
jgi:hypothetical protein